MGWFATARARNAALAAASIALALVATRAPIALASTVSEPPEPSENPARSDAAAPRFRPADWETLAAGLPEAVRLRPVFGFRYNRVDGPAPTLGAAVGNEENPVPLARLLATYAYSRERLLPEAGFEVPLGDPVRFRVGGAAYRRTATEDAWIVDELENTAYALLARTDYRDHYESRGFEGYGTWEPGRDFALRAGARLEKQSSLRTRTRVSLFGKDDRFRPNPPIEEGEDHALTIGARVGPAWPALRPATTGELIYERSGDPLGGDFDYERVLASVRARMRFSRRKEARARVIGESTIGGALPSQKVRHLGGIGTLRGHGYKSFHGDQVLLANAEGYLLVRKNVWGFAFLDWGATWFGRRDLHDQRFALDGGVGFRIGDGPVAVTAARNLQDADAPILIGVRIGSTF